MEKKASGEKLITINRKATHDFAVEKRYEAGLQLTGSEVKSCRGGLVQLVDSFAAFNRGELFLHKAHISEYKQSGPHFNHPPARTRKLLMHRRELVLLEAMIAQKGYTLIPLRMYFKRGVAKIEIGLARGKTKGDKRQSDKLHDAEREIGQAQRRRRNTSADYDD